MKTKHFWNLLAIMVVAVMSMGFTSCSSDDGDDANPLVGTWVQNHTTDDSSFQTFVFRSDGTGSSTTTWTSDKSSYTDQFHYAYDSTTKTLTITLDDGKSYIVATVAITGSTLSLTFSTGSGGLRTYTKQ